MIESTIMLSPYFNYKINGEWVDEEILKRTTSLDVVQSDEKSDSARIVIEDSTYAVFDSSSIFEGAAIEVFGGYSYLAPSLFKGNIAGLDPSFPANGGATLTLVCMDESYPLSINKVKVQWKDVKRSDIIKRIAMKYGLGSNVQDTKIVVTTISQTDETDAALIMKLASDEGFICYIRSGVINFHARNLSGKSIKDYWYNSGDSSLISFKPQFVAIKDVTTQPTTAAAVPVPVVVTKEVTNDKTTTTATVIPDSFPKIHEIYHPNFSNSLMNRPKR